VGALTRQRAARFKKQARTRFDGWADTYDRSLLNHYMFRPSYLALLEEIARWRAEHGGAFRLLDVGSGTGTLAGMLLRGGWPVTVVGLDYSPAMCARALAKLPPTTHGNRSMFTAGDSEHVPFASESFDVVICANSFHHYPHQQAVLEEMRRVLRPGGRLILIDGFRDNVVGWFVFDVIIARVEGSIHHAPWHEVHAGFEQAGLRNIRRRKLGLLFPLVATIGDA
jgi:ubiquinone/menaquinone biosynthesis C-methylase UbiE